MACAFWRGRKVTIITTAATSTTAATTAATIATMVSTATVADAAGDAARDAARAASLTTAVLATALRAGLLPSKPCLISPAAHLLARVEKDGARAADEGQPEHCVSSSKVI